VLFVSMTTSSTSPHLQYSSAYTLRLPPPKAVWYLILYIGFSEIAGMAQRFAIGSCPSRISLQMPNPLQTIINLLSLLGSIGIQKVGVPTEL
jgi:hypothetical protein